VNRSQQAWVLSVETLSPCDAHRHLWAGGLGRAAWASGLQCVLPNDR
jgi:hypothetical protein